MPPGIPAEISSGLSRRNPPTFYCKKSPSEDVSGSSFLDTSRSYLEIFFQKLLNFLQTISNNNSCGNLSSRFFEDFFRTFTEDCLVCFCSNSSRHFSKQWVTVKISPEIQLQKFRREFHKELLRRFIKHKNFSRNSFECTQNDLFDNSC